jgi:hypothetical protein
LRAAVLRGHRPTTYLLGKQPYSKWNDLDRALGLAYQIHEDEISNETGLPLWIARNDDPEILFEVKPGSDKAARELRLFDMDDGKKKERERAGRYRFAVAVDAYGEPLEYGGLTRHRYLMSAIQDPGFDPSEYGD